jgi:hypothetical protein
MGPRKTVGVDDGWLLFMGIWGQILPPVLLFLVNLPLSISFSHLSHIILPISPSSCPLVSPPWPSASTSVLF